MTPGEIEAWVRQLKKYPYMEAKGLACCGAYLIYERDSLLYVGESADVGTRLIYHLGKPGGGNLFWHLVDDTPESASGERAHHCTCGKMIRCPDGDRIYLPYLTIRSINKRFETFTVLVAEFPPDDLRRFQFEKDCQEHLKPRYPREAAIRSNKSPP